MTLLCMYYIPCFELVKHSVYIYIYIYQNKREFSLDKEFEWAYANAKDINQIIKYLIVNKAKGPDGTSAKFVKMSTDIIDYHIANVIIKDISDNKYSKNAKTATVRPNFKKGDSTEIKNYTPVTLLNILTKTYKRFLHKNLTNYADTFLSKFILAYRKLICSDYVLIRLIENWAKSLEFLDAVHCVKSVRIRSIWSFLSVRLEGEETLKYRCVCRPPCGKVS